jgi:hypothetical protein
LAVTAQSIRDAWADHLKADHEASIASAKAQLEAAEAPVKNAEDVCAALGRLGQVFVETSQLAVSHIRAKRPGCVKRIMDDVGLVAAATAQIAECRKAAAAIDDGVAPNTDAIRYTPVFVPSASVF